MANNVFANGREISCKSGSGKTIAAFPDVCFTPPECPATPPGVPIPYPNTGKASDTTSGSKTVKVSGKEVMLKNKSYYKTSMGDEAGCAAKKGVLTSVNKGKVYFTSWSMDVKFESENVVRHLDLTTHNHMSLPGNSPCWPNLDTTADSNPNDPCHDIAKEVKEECVDRGKIDPKRKTIPRKKRRKSAANPKGEKKEPAFCKDKKCKTAMKCVVAPYSPNKCCDGMTPHHIVPASQFKEAGEDGASISPTYEPNKAPCICVQGHTHTGGKHGQIHAKTNKLTPDKPRWKVGEAEEAGAQATADVTDCNKDCIKQQTRAGHKQMDVMAKDKIRPTHPGGKPEADDTTY